MKMSRFLPALAAALSLTAIATGVRGDAPKVLAVEAFRAGMGWRIDVTIQHDDAGWDHYADGWRIEDETGKPIAVRELMHPHVEEQPFTRSLFNVMLPDGVTHVWIRAHCDKSGWSETRYEVDLKR